MPKNIQSYYRTLTNCQKKAFSEILEFVRSKNKYHKLTGYAGTGKSYLIVTLINYLQTELGKQIIVASPTNKAAKNIKNLSTQVGLSVESTTVAKLLGLQPNFDEEQGNEVFMSLIPEQKIKYNIIIIDEYSMLSKDNLEALYHKTLRTYTKIIFVGDSAQLPPVKEQLSPVDTWPLINSFSSLTEIVRHDNEIINISQQIRTNSLYNRQLYPFTTTKDQSVICLSRKQWCAKAQEFFSSSQFKDDPNYCRILVWTNNKANQINTAIRKYLYGNNCQPFEIGDLLIAKRPVFRPFKHPKKGSSEWRIIINNSEECRVIGKATLTTETITILNQTYSFDCWNVPVLTEDYRQWELMILTSESNLYFTQIKAKLRTMIQTAEKHKKGLLWQEYFVLDRTFDDVPFAYAITTHKAQGSSINYVFIDIQDFRRCDNLQQLQYTAITRAVNQVWLPQ